jgi:glycosyltransferase involved in cell wall biosynthesis
MKEFSVITIARGRRQQLANQLMGILESTVLPAEYIIVLMDEEPFELPSTDKIEIIIKRCNPNLDKLPLASARNLGYKAAKTDNLIFIDVDCIPSPTVFEQLNLHLTDQTIVSAYPRYIPYVPTSPWSYQQVLLDSIKHPKREAIPHSTSVDLSLFWSLVFALRKQTMEKIGGFDTGYQGYGGEDTDFAFKARTAAIELIFVHDIVLHQYHDKYDPPLNYFHDIIANAERFYSKWQTWPMTSWLDKFEALKLIHIKHGHIKIIGEPTREMIDNAYSALPY